MAGQIWRAFFFFFFFHFIIFINGAFYNFLAENGFQDTAIYLSPPVFNHTLLGPIGIGTNASFYLAEWEIAYPLSTQASYSRGNCIWSGPILWNIANPSARVCLGKQSNNHLVYELAQSGTNVSCGNEFDLFISPNDGNYPKFPQNIKPLSQSAPLSSFLNIYFNFSFDVAYSSITLRCGTNPQCQSSGKVDYSYAVAALTLDNTNTSQTLFYQIMLWDSRQTLGCSFPVNPCVNFTYWFFQTNPFGFSEAISNYGGPCLSPGGSLQPFSLNVLPHLINALKQGTTYGIDPSPWNWKISGFYIGTGLQGQASSVVFVSDVALYGTI